MKITFDPAKRETTLLERGLDMALAEEVFKGPHITFEDNRHDYGEARLVTFGQMGNRLVFVAWTQRGDTHRIISMGKANEREQKRYGRQLG